MSKIDNFNVMFSTYILSIVCSYYTCELSNMTPEYWESLPYYPPTQLLDIDPGGDIEVHGLENRLKMAKVYKAVSTIHTDQAHDIQHVNEVLEHALGLWRWCQRGSWEYIYVAACLHDLGRTDPTLHQEASVERSIQLAGPILLDSGYSEEDRGVIEQIIRDHNKTGNRACSVEGLILREADSLAGMGAWGIFRTVAHGTRSGRSTREILDMFRNKLPDRIRSLVLPPAKELAFSQWATTCLFLAELDKPPRPETERRPKNAFYIVFEGISGTGKNCQMEMLRSVLTSKGVVVTTVEEPTPVGKQVVHLIKTGTGISNGGITEREKALVMAVDRIPVGTIIKDSLASGKTLLGGRSFVSSMAYQGDSPQTMAEVFHLNRRIPRPDLVIWLDINNKAIALNRIQGRHQTVGVPIGDYEELEKLILLSARFRQALELSLVPFVRIETSGSMEEIATQITKAVLCKLPWDVSSFS